MPEPEDTRETKLFDRYVGVARSLSGGSSRLMSPDCVKLGSLPEDGAVDGVKVDELRPEVREKVRARAAAMDEMHNAVKLTSDYLTRFKRLWPKKEG